MLDDDELDYDPENFDDPNHPEYDPNKCDSCSGTGYDALDGGQCEDCYGTGENEG